MTIMNDRNRTEPRIILLTNHDYFIMKSLLILIRIMLFILITTSIIVFIRQYYIHIEVQQRIHHALNDRGTLDWPMPVAFLSSSPESS
ncbi:hypothetical protein DERF_010747 [Dermatophagoides farinae]|uniref:Uncharacterized protein n=1 Tax=Dermatophagoides farinae TaxID=6954 RepID=A0A922L0Z5_DERFA|nr:hypothetical protein DERF_010747 [Dermatophagoides farinae]